MNNEFGQHQEAIQNASALFPPNEPLILENDKEINIIANDNEFHTINTKCDFSLNIWPSQRYIFSLSSNDRSYEIELQNSSNIIQQKSQVNLNHSTFYLLNFPFCLGKIIRRTNKERSLYSGRLVINFNDWRITLDKMEAYNSLKKEIQNNDGYLITYAGKVGKNGQSFSSDELKVQIIKLYWLLAFARGALAAPVMLQGYCEDSDLKWQDGSLLSVGRWSLSQNNNWFSKKQANQIFEAISSGWNDLYENVLWRKELPKILYWYTYAGRGVEGAGTDGSVILALSALELLAFNYLIVDKKIRDKEKFEKKSLSNNIYKVLEDLNISISLPRKLYDLNEYSKNKDWQTGPKAITELRNEIVHPARESSPGSMVCYQGLQLSLWYVEMILLRMCKYEGIYNNRLNISGWSGEGMRTMENEIRINHN